MEINSFTVRRKKLKDHTEYEIKVTLLPQAEE